MPPVGSIVTIPISSMDGNLETGFMTPLMIPHTQLPNTDFISNERSKARRCLGKLPSPLTVHNSCGPVKTF